MLLLPCPMSHIHGAWYQSHSWQKLRLLILETNIKVNIIHRLAWVVWPFDWKAHFQSDIRTSSIFQFRHFSISQNFHFFSKNKNEKCLVPLCSVFICLSACHLFFAFCIFFFNFGYGFGLWLLYLYLFFDFCILPVCEYHSISVCNLWKCIKMWMSDAHMQFLIAWYYWQDLW